MKKRWEGFMEYDNDQMCFVCGKRNRDGLQLDFELVGEGGIRTEFTPPKRYQGWKDIVHGGIIATILDEVMVNAAYLRKIVAVSAKLEIKLRKPAAVGERLIFHGRIVRQGAKTLKVKAWAEQEDGDVVAEATGLLMKVGVLNG
jgi:acyl-coenzyme A thioesterase PaaI-like protein